MNWNPPIDLGPLFIFLDRCSWIFSFRWIDPTEKDTEVQGLQSALREIPTAWAKSLTNATIENLRALVSGSADGYPWPQDLLQFAFECRRFTALVSQNICLLPTMLSRPILAYNPNANCVDFLPDERVLYAKHSLHMTPKKSHEVSRMTAFLHHLLLSRTVECETNAAADGLVGTFQTSPLLSAPRTQALLSPPYVVDIGSGLGHLPNSLAQRLLQSTTTIKVDQCPFRIYAVDCDPALDRKARLLLQRSAPIGGDIGTQLLSHRVKRLLFHLTESNTTDFSSLLNESLKFEAEQSSSTSRQSSTYLLCGLHCCGDLSQSMIQLFENDVRAEWLVLVGCCYHKMSLSKFPASDRLRMAFKSAPQLMRNFCSKATFRLACQWSPSTWLSWTQRDCNMHRVRLICRILFATETGKFDPIKNCLKLAPMLESGSFDFSRLLSLLPQTPCTDEQIIYLTTVWNLTPGLLALQQLLQPLLEVILLADRVWRLRTDDPQRQSGMFAGLVRLFDPRLSPRCMALVVRKSLFG